jgi:hypothetical protein
MPPMTRLCNQCCNELANAGVDYITACFRDLGFSLDDARARALLSYAVYLGTLRLVREVPDWPPDDLSRKAYLRQILATLVPATEGGDEDTYADEPVAV